MATQQNSSSASRSEHSLYVQAWFKRTGDSHEATVVHAYLNLLAKYEEQGVTSKDILGYAILALAKEDNLDSYIEARRTTESEALARMSGLVAKLERSASIISDMANQIASGVVFTPADANIAQSAANEFKQAKDELTQEQEIVLGSIASEYNKGKTFDIED